MPSSTVWSIVFRFMFSIVTEGKCGRRFLAFFDQQSGRKLQDLKLGMLLLKSRFFGKCRKANSAVSFHVSFRWAYNEVEEHVTHWVSLLQPPHPIMDNVYFNDIDKRRSTNHLGLVRRTYHLPRDSRLFSQAVAIHTVGNIRTITQSSVIKLPINSASLATIDAAHSAPIRDSSCTICSFSVSFIFILEGVPITSRNILPKQ